MYDEVSQSPKAESVVMTKRRIMKNLISVSLGFMLLFSAFMALANLQSTMNNAGNMGVTSQSITYTMFLAGSLFLPKIVIRKFGCKLTVVFSMLTYFPYLAANVYPSPVTLLFTAAIMGIGASTLWASVNTYVNQLGFWYAKGDIKKAALSSSTFFAIFQTFFQTTQIWGNFVSFYVFKPTDLANISISDSLIMNETNLSCGAKFCGGMSEATQNVLDEQRFILVGIYSGLSVIAVILTAFFMDSLKNHNLENNDKKEMLQNLSATFKQMVKPDQMLLVALKVFNGLETGFFYSDYSQAYVACGLSLDIVGLIFVCYGVVSTVTCIFVSRIMKHVPRTVIMTTAAVSYSGVFLALLLWEPNKNVTPYYIVVGFSAFSDVILAILLKTLLGTLFRKNEEAAFANFSIFKSIGCLIAFSCSSLLCTTTKIYMLFVFLVFGMSGYYTIELRALKNMQRFVLEN